MSGKQYPTREEYQAVQAQYLEGADAKAQALHDQLVAQGYQVSYARYPAVLDGTYRFEIMF
ncbi:MAG: hypothetical protein AB7T74_04815 [Clostridia bacterium]